ncbi:glycosyltransferase [Clostridium sp. MT-14]|uniref:glycosyltransferase n=1 Tax=Clostridium sp. MT-14 TaxID=3348360 RepID=UPI0035F45410
MCSEDITVSVAMITYNHEKYLRKALDSILMQKVDFKYEVIVGEDCSPDNSREILKEYKRKYPDIFRMIYRDKNIGATKNSYDVFTKCKGKYIAILEGDDFWTDEFKLKTQVKFLKNNEEYSGVYHKVTVSDEFGTIIKNMPSDKFIIQNNIHEIGSPKRFIELCYETMGQVFHVQSLIFKNIFLKYNNYGKIKNLLTTADYICDTQLKLLVLERGKIKLINKVMGNYRYIRKRNETSFSSQNILVHYSNIKNVWKAVDQYFDYKYGYLIKKLIIKEKYMVIFDRFKNKDMKNVFILFINELNFKGKIGFINYFNKRLITKIKKC